MCVLFDEIEKNGIKEGRKEGVMAIIKMCYEFGVPEELIPGKICSNIDVSLEEASGYIKEYKKI